MVDRERAARLLAEIRDNISSLSVFLDISADSLIGDALSLDAMKYRFIKAIEGCARVAHHIVASEGWRVPETNGDAVRVLGRQGVVPHELAEAVAEAVGFRNLLVHQYGDVDNAIAIGHLDDLDDLRRFTSHVARWLEQQER